MAAVVSGQPTMANLHPAAYTTRRQRTLLPSWRHQAWQAVRPHGTCRCMGARRLGTTMTGKVRIASAVDILTSLVLSGAFLPQGLTEQPTHPAACLAPSSIASASDASLQPGTSLAPHRTAGSDCCGPCRCSGCSMTDTAPAVTALTRPRVRRENRLKRSRPATRKQRPNGSLATINHVELVSRLAVRCKGK